MRYTRTIYILMAALFLQSCHHSITTNEKSSNFDIPKFIQTEVERLEKLNPIITKTVITGESTETKKMKISNWKKEFSHFSTVDLNKTGNTDFISEKINDTLFFTTPQSTKNKIIVKLVLSNDSLIELNIQKESQNLLFVNEEELHYKVGKTYEIQKTQHVKGMGGNQYVIKGEF